MTPDDTAGASSADGSAGGASDDGSGEVPDDADDEGEWRFSLEDLNQEEPAKRPIEPGDISLENAVFVILGVLATLFVVYHVTTLLGA